jgi:putative transcriptional regulator
MKDARITRATPDTGKGSGADWTRFDSMTESQRVEAALDDPDAQPLSPADMQRMRSTPRAKIIRRALGLTQEEFSTRYLIPLGTLRDWEQGRTEPDQPARAYLKVIARDPDGVSRALHEATEQRARQRRR